MSRAKELFQSGQLAASIEEVTREVKVNPSDPQRRTFLFELLCFAGEWDRAEKQLEVISHQNMQAVIGVQAYRNNIKAERDRERLFSDGLQPHYLREPPAYVDLHTDAVNRLRENRADEARALLDRAEEERPALGGKINGDQPFADFRDYNDFVGPVLELIVQDQYAWLPFEQIARIDFTPPKNLRDLIWSAARVEARDGTVGEIYVPNLYADSGDHHDDQVKLGRMTDWKDLGADLYRPAGLRLFLIDGEDRSLLDVRSVEFDSPAIIGDAPADAEARQIVH